jgi:hypothetical protein
MGDVTRLADARADEDRVGLDELAREGARRMIAAALEVEVDDYVASFAEELDEQVIGWSCETVAAKSAG